MTGRGRPPVPAPEPAAWAFHFDVREHDPSPNYWVVGRAVGRPEMRWGPYAAADAVAQRARLEAGPDAPRPGAR